MTEKKKLLEFYEEKDGWRWRLTTSNNEVVGESRQQAFSSEPAAINNFLMLITMGNAEISRAVQEHGIFR